jgi:multiple sugar transport system substrate-binding protein
MKRLARLREHFAVDFQRRYWLSVLIITALLALHIVAKSGTSPPVFLKYIQDFLPEAISAVIGALIAFSVHDYRNKSLKIRPHVIYPLVAGVPFFFLILLSFGVFSTTEISISGNGDGQFDKGEFQRISRINADLAKLKKNVKVSLDMNYEFARQTEDYPQPVNVNRVYSKLTEGIEGGEKYDIYELDIIWIPEFVEKGWIVPLDQYRKKSDVLYTYWIEQEAGRFACEVDGNTVMQTHVRANFINVGFLMYRIDLFHELIGKEGEPSSWDELVEWLYEVREKYGDAYDGFVFQGDEYEGLLVNFFEILWAHGGEVVEEDGIPQVNTPVAVKALSFLEKLIQDGIVPEEVLTYNEALSQEHFRKGRTLVHRNWARTFHTIQNDPKFKDLKNRVHVMSRPLAFKGVARGSAKMCLGGWYYAISKDAYEAGKAKQAMEVIEHLTSVEQFTEAVYPARFSEGIEVYSIRIPANQLVLENAKGEKDALDYTYDYFKNRYYRSRPKFAYYAVFSEILVRHIHQGLKDPDISAEETLRNAQEELNRIIPNLTKK